ncbi:Protein Tob2 [Zootermopsis nevadensis]|uniref:Protein Tob2 n=1 Tax=Zootermopsis nevadensis TaxID=136037 RepID=A0A067RCY1_ZOONE|nr:Protein Tob2 [Zootermopsis nevadensis]
MHIEVQVALNFVISYLYNKLPRRRVNIFGEELEKALKDKFKGHWYPEKPFKGSAFRCLKTGDPVDPVLERAARESGVPIQDVLENLPQELAVWVDPGEVSYRIGEKGAVKVLFSELADPHDDSSADREVTKTFNPEAQCFRPIEAVGSTLGSLSLSPNKSSSPYSVSAVPVSAGGGQGVAVTSGSGTTTATSSASSPTPLTAPYKGSPSPVTSFIPRSTAPLTFTTATFAQTKFGSTKLKTNTKRANRMSPTEFSNYIKQRAIQQQIHHHHHHHHHQAAPPSPTGRSLSPNTAAVTAGQQPPDPTGYFFQPAGPYHPQFPHRNLFEAAAAAAYMPELYPAAATKFPGATASSYLDPASVGHQFYNGASTNASNQGSVQVNNNATSSTAPQDNGKQLLEGLNNFGLGSVAPYPPSPYQHLLVAN